MVRFDAGLFFVDADALEDRLRTLAHDAEPKCEAVVLDFEGVNYMDSQGSGSVQSVYELARNYGAELRLARVKLAPLEILRSDGVVDAIGAQNVFDTVYEATEDRIKASA